ncbi:MAG TPA: ATPase [Candidatus Dependentiae bacterium]|nr:ATPase [Candidatus Dependentiae bacterium]
MPFFIRKRSGKKEEFNIKKLRLSLDKAGADSQLINQIIEKIKKQKPCSTKAIHKLITQMLTKQSPAIAARYNLKRALMELGPAGYPFEQFVAHVFAAQGYKTMTNQIISGKCVDHEIDITATKANKHFMIECKFHNRFGLKTNVKVILSIQARFEDVRTAWEQNPEHKYEFHRAWVVTNTRFTSEAIKYAECMGIKLLGWKHPENQGIGKVIDTVGLHPITALTSLTHQQKRAFIKEGFVLCRDASKHIAFLKSLGFSARQIKKLIKEAETTCFL